MDRHVVVGNVLLCILLPIAMVHMAVSIPKALWQDLVLALRNSAPVIRVDYMNFSLVGIIVGGIAVHLLLCMIMVAKLLNIAPEKIGRHMEKLVKVMVVALVFMFPVPMVVGAAVSEYVESQGYRPCRNLFEGGFMRYRRGFVLDQRLCVPPRHLGEALRRYGYNPLPTYQ